MSDKNKKQNLEESIENIDNVQNVAKNNQDKKNRRLYIFIW